MPISPDLTQSTAYFRHPQLGDRSVQAVVPLNVRGGYKVALDILQAAILEDIQAQSGKLDNLVSLLTKVGEIKSLMESSGTTAIEQKLSGDIQASLDAISSNTGNSDTTLSNLAVIEEASRVLLTSIEEQVGGYTSALNAIAINQGVQIGRDYAQDAPHLVSLDLAIVDKEYSFLIPQNTIKFLVKCRGGSGDAISPFRYAFTSGIVATETDIAGTSFYTVEGSQEEESPLLRWDEDKTIYFASSDPVVLSIKLWQN